jgi:hypothetical protein
VPDFRKIEWIFTDSDECTYDNFCNWQFLEVNSQPYNTPISLRLAGFSQPKTYHIRWIGPFQQDLCNSKKAYATFGNTSDSKEIRVVSGFSEYN